MSTQTELTALIESIDTAVRTAAARAHSNLMEELAQVKSFTIGECTIPREAMLPREVQEARRVSMEFAVQLRDDGVDLVRSANPLRGYSPAKMVMEWEATEVPEATALVRTKAETIVAKEIKHG